MDIEAWRTTSGFWDYEGVLSSVPSSPVAEALSQGPPTTNSEEEAIEKTLFASVSFNQEEVEVVNLSQRPPSSISEASAYESGVTLPPEQEQETSPLKKSGYDAVAINSKLLSSVAAWNSSSWTLRCLSALRDSPFSAQVQPFGSYMQHKDVFSSAVPACYCVS